MTSGGGWVGARGADQPLAHCAESAAAPRPVSGRQAEAGSQTACLIKAGTLLNIWLYFHHGTHALRSARSGKLCAGFTAGPED
jgi:hypothetical protein